MSRPRKKKPVSGGETGTVAKATSGTKVAKPGLTAVRVRLNWPYDRFRRAGLEFGKQWVDYDLDKAQKELIRESAAALEMQDVDAPLLESVEVPAENDGAEDIVSNEETNVQPTENGEDGE